MQNKLAGSRTQQSKDCLETSFFNNYILMGKPKASFSYFLYPVKPLEPSNPHNNEELLIKQNNSSFPTFIEKN